MSFRDKFYSSYNSTHTRNLYGDFSVVKKDSRAVAWKAYFLKYLDKKNARILDIGCGDGSFLLWLTGLGFKKTEGIDISEEQISLALSIGVKNVFQGDLREFLKRSEEKYDIVFVRDVLEHFTKEEAFEVANLVFASLNLGGKIIIQTVNAENILWGRLRYGDFTHELAFTSESISQFLHVVGFNKIMIFPQRPVSHGIKSSIRLLLWYIFELKMRLYLLIETGTAKGSIFTQNIIVEAEK